MNVLTNPNDTKATRNAVNRVDLRARLINVDQTARGNPGQPLAQCQALRGDVL
jgi:hypothetical protein